MYSTNLHNISTWHNLLECCRRQPTASKIIPTTGWPVIVPLRTGELPHWSENIDHAVVVVGMDEHSVYLNDPAFATAPIQVPHGDFDLAWLEREEYYAVLAP
jgi:predicted double-glycine peptidase